MLSNSAKVTQLVSDGIRILIQACLTPEPVVIPEPSVHRGMFPGTGLGSKDV